MSCNCGAGKQIEKIYGEFGFKKAITSEEKIGYKLKVIVYAIISTLTKIITLPLFILAIIAVYPFLSEKVISIDKLFGLKKNKTLEEYVRNKQIIQNKD